MALRNPITRALRTYSSALYAARATYHTAKAIKRRLAVRKQNKTNSVVNRVRQKTRGHLMNNPKAFDRSTMAGQQRRDNLAKKLHTMSRTKRSRTGSLQGIKGLKNPLTRKPYPGKIVLQKGMTGGQLRRRTIVHVVKDISGHQLKTSGGDRKEAAIRLRAMHNSGERGDHMNYTKSMTRANTPDMIKRAATAYRKAFRGK